MPIAMLIGICGAPAEINVKTSAQLTAALAEPAGCGAVIRMAAGKYQVPAGLTIVYTTQIIAEPGVELLATPVHVLGEVELNELVMSGCTLQISGRAVIVSSDLVATPVEVLTGGKVEITRSTLHNNLGAALTAAGDVVVHRSTFTANRHALVLLQGKHRVQQSTFGPHTGALFEVHTNLAWSANVTEPEALAPLGMNGGPVPTHALLLGPHVDAFVCEDRDARGEVPFGLCDEGAYERVPMVLEMTCTQSAREIDAGESVTATCVVRNIGTRRSSGVRVDGSPYRPLPAGDEMHVIVTWQPDGDRTFVAEALEGANQTAVTVHITVRAADVPLIEPEAEEAPLEDEPAESPEIMVMERKSAPPVEPRGGCAQATSVNALVLALALARRRSAARRQARAQ